MTSPAQQFTRTTPRVALSLVAAALVVGLGVVALFALFGRAERAAELRKENRARVNDANNLMSAMKDAETGQRGFLLTGDDAFLAPYSAVRDSVGGRLTRLRASTINVASRQQLDALTPLLDATLAEMARVIAERRTVPASERERVAGTPAITLGELGKRQMDSIRTLVHTFVTGEEALLDVSERRYATAMHRLLIAIIATSLFALVWAIAFAWLMHQRAREQLKVSVQAETQALLAVQRSLNAQLQQSNATLTASKNQLAVTLSSIGDAVIATDAEARITLLNPVAQSLTGWSQASAVRMPVSHVFQIINKGTRRPAVIPVVATLAEGTVQGLANHTVLVGRDGSERDIADSCAPIRNADGQVIGAVLVFRDVTADYAVQQELRDGSALIEAVMNTVTDGIVTMRATGATIERVNATTEQLFGYAAIQLVGKPFSVLVPELGGDGVDGSLMHYASDRNSRQAGMGREVTGRRKDGSTIPLEIAISEMQLAGQRYFTGTHQPRRVCGVDDGVAAHHSGRDCRLPFIGTT